MHGFTETQISVFAALILCTLTHELVFVYGWYPALWHGLVLVQGRHFVLMTHKLVVVEGWHQHSDRQFTIGAGLRSCNLVRTQINVGAGLTHALWHTNQCFVGLTFCTLTQKSGFCRADILYPDTEISVLQGWHPVPWHRNQCFAGLTFCTLTQKSVFCRADILYRDTEISVCRADILYPDTEISVLQGWHPVPWHGNQCFAGLTFCTLTQKSVFCRADILYRDTEISVL